MYKITAEVDGMACGMCEAHVNDAIREAFQVKKVSSSHSKGLTEIIAEDALDEEKVKEVIKESGYTPGKVTVEPYKKKGFSLFQK